MINKTFFFSAAAKGGEGDQCEQAKTIAKHGACERVGGADLASLLGIRLWNQPLGSSRPSRQGSRVNPAEAGPGASFGTGHHLPSIIIPVEAEAPELRQRPAGMRA